MQTRSGRSLWGVVIALLAVSMAACSDAPSLAETERAVELNVQGLQARYAGDFDSSADMLEEACLLQHEPSCQAVWLQLDLGTDSEDTETRERLEGTAAAARRCSRGGAVDSLLSRAHSDGPKHASHRPLARAQDALLPLVSRDAQSWE